MSSAESIVIIVVRPRLEHSETKKEMNFIEKNEKNLIRELGSNYTNINRAGKVVIMCAYVHNNILCVAWCFDAFIRLTSLTVKATTRAGIEFNELFRCTTETHKTQHSTIFLPCYFFLLWAFKTYLKVLGLLCCLCHTIIVIIGYIKLPSTFEIHTNTVTKWRAVPYVITVNIGRTRGE